MIFNENGSEEIEKIYICTSLKSKLHRFYRLKTGDVEKKVIYDTFKYSLEENIRNEENIDVYNQNSLIQDDPYKIKLSDIKEDSYLNEFKKEIDNFFVAAPQRVIQFKQFGKLKNEIVNFDEKEGLKFLLIQTINSLLLLSITTNSIIKNKKIISLSVTSDTTVTDIPKGIQVPQFVTARIDISDKELYVYDVNTFEKMLTSNENIKAKAKKTLENFREGNYKIGEENYVVKGLDDTQVYEMFTKSARSIRRLSNYNNSKDQYKISKIKQAVEKLEVKEQRVLFDDDTKSILVSNDSAKTFVAIIHNSIIERLISGEVEITI